MVGNDPPANGAVASALTYLAPLFLVFLVIVANNEHAMKFYDTCASELQMERTQFLLLISTVATLFLASWKLVVYYFQIQKEAMEKKIIYESERDALILIFESTGEMIHRTNTILIQLQPYFLEYRSYQDNGCDYLLISLLVICTSFENSFHFDRLI